MYPYKDLYVNLHISFIWNSQNLQTQMSRNRYVEQQMAVHPHNRILRSNERNELFKSQGNYAVNTKPEKKNT